MSFFTLNPILTPLSSSSSLKPNLPSSSSSSSCNCRVPFIFSIIPRSRFSRHVVRMAPDEERMTRRSPLDFPVEWEKPRPGRRSDIFPQFSPMKTPLPTPMPADPPEEDEEEEEKKEEEENPEQDEEENPDQK